ncbi:MAG: SMP-30/gluconolactonase/LRE family protein [bacterium]|nr:SMP-30/gluconolactonase/LRE family protein [bacterium]
MTAIVREARVLVRPAPEHGYLPEGPRVLPDGRLLWITIQCGATGELATRGAIHTFDLETGESQVTDLPGRPGFALPSEDPNVVLLGMERSLGWLNLQSGEFDEVVTGLDDHCEGTIINDGEPSAHGIVFGMKDTAFAEHKGGLYFLRQHDGELLQLRRDALCSNGKVLRELPTAASDATPRLELFDIDSPTRVVRRYELDVATGQLSAGEIAIDLTGERAVPDGMVQVPGRDEVVIAMFDPEFVAAGRALRCSLATGEVLAEYRTPGAAQVTCPVWLESQEGRFVLLTTAAENLAPESLARQPDAGCLFLAEA